jgi:hypothetical protein
VALRVLVIFALVAALLPRAVHAQANGQLWGEFSLAWPRSQRLTYGVDLEPKALVVAPAGAPGWVTLDVTPSVDYAAKKWLDLVGGFMSSSTSG